MMIAKVYELLTLMLVLSMLFSAAVCPGLAEATTWDCPQCGRSGNTGKYCGSCAHPAPWMENVFWFDIPEATLNEKTKSLAEESKKWTQKTCPQTINAFPLIPAGLLEQKDTIKNAESFLYNDGKRRVWKTNVPSYYPDDWQGNGPYLLDDMNGMTDRKHFDVLTDGNYAIPEDVREKDIKGFALEPVVMLDNYIALYGYRNDFEDFGKINSSITISVGLQDLNGKCSISWSLNCRSGSEREYFTVSFIYHDSRDNRLLIYDARTGRLQQMSTIQY